MRVERDAVGALDAAEALGAALREDEEAAVRAVDVHPQAVLLGDVGDASSGSTAPVFVVPALGTTRNGRRPAARSSSTMRRKASGSIRSSASVGTSRTFRFENPASVAAFVTEACACSLT